MNIFTLGLILASVSLNSLAQVFLRRGMMGGPANLFRTNAIFVLVENPWLWLGMLCYAVSILIWLVVLSKLQVSVAYPFLSIGYIIAAVLGYWFLGEAVGPQRIFGLMLICGGLFFIGRSA